MSEHDSLRGPRAGRRDADPELEPRALASFKLRPFDGHVWVMREGAATGSTLRGEQAALAFLLGGPLFELASPGAPERVRALSVDLARARLLATLESEGKPVSVRVDGQLVRDAVSPGLLRHLRGDAEPAEP